MAAAIAEEPESRAREMAALLPRHRDMMIALGILSGEVIDARERFRFAGVGLPTARTVDFDWPGGAA